MLDFIQTGAGQSGSIPDRIGRTGFFLWERDGTGVEIHSVSCSSALRQWLENQTQTGQTSGAPVYMQESKPITLESHGRCTRENCKYLHPPAHLKTQLEINGRNNLIQQKTAAAMLLSRLQFMIPGNTPCSQW
ncbi:hypothetical protein WMY93_022238 [Mugilogobius chulae]|uniref:Muscleblind-like CCCH zinc finger domain-containing protein n=1 Tax=Mugilogobius chulae TaxID=88201 RepID=A0AAW0N6E3_9GOBI